MLSALVFQRAVKEGILVENPCDKADPSKMDTKPKKAISPDKVHELIEQLDPTDPHECAYLLAVTLGLRRGERVQPGTMSRGWSIDRKEFGLEGYALHELRHTYLTMLAMGGVHPKVMLELAGHYSS